MDMIEKSRNPPDSALKSWSQDELDLAKGYKADDGLIDAINAALLLKQPLLLTGEPGVGKTQFAHYVSWQLELNPPLMFETKSTSTARDLFYIYDTLTRFHDAQLDKDGGRSIDQLDYITYNALGIAIVRTNKAESIARWVPSSFKHDGPQRSVVLIDEVDKAPRDFPNDILNEVEYMYFKVPELRNPATHEVPRIESDKELKPVLILTSNSQKHLPEAFLRRCVYYNIPFPDEKRLIEIVLARIKTPTHDMAELGYALGFFFRLRESDTIVDKKPSTAELLGWLKAVHNKSTLKRQRLRDMDKQAIGSIFESTLCVLLKSDTDQKAGRAILKRWLSERAI